MGKLIDLTGQRFGKLTVISPAPSKKKRTMWLCLCDCGTKKIIGADKLVRGMTLSCGCYRLQNRTKHGQSRTRLYKIWEGMKQRCNNPHVERYSHYGGRGIKVCKEWADSFEAFYAWAMAHGYADNLQIDRIDNDGNYTPENCRWATRVENQSNTRQNVIIELNGERHTIAEWARITGISRSTINRRITAGKSPAEILKK